MMHSPDRFIFVCAEERCVDRMADLNDRSCDAFSETSLVAELAAKFGVCYEDDLVA